MPQKRTINVQFPRGGLSKRYAYQNAPPFTCLSASNVRPEGPFEKRLRGGSRPCLTKSFATQIGSGNPVYMAAIMRSLANENRLTHEEGFANLDNWTAMDASWADDGALTISGGQVSVGAVKDCGSVLNLNLPSSIEDASGIVNAPYSVEVYVPSFTALAGGWIDIYLYARLEDAPVTTSNVVAKVRITTTGSWSYQLYLGVNDTPVYRTAQIVFSPSTVGDFWFRLTIAAQTATAEMIPGASTNLDYLTASVDLTLPTSYSALAANESRFGLRVDNYTNTTAVPLDDFIVRYFDAAGGVPPESFVAASKHDGASGKQGANVWYETNNGEMTEVPCKRGTGAAGEETDEETDLNHGVHIMAVDYLGKMYIADHGEKQSGTDGKVSASPFTTFHDVADTDWSEATGIGVDEHGDWLEILSTGTGGNAILGVYKITAASDAGITVDTAMATAEETSGVQYRIVRGPKVFDPSAAAGSKLTRWEPTTGNIPLNCSILEIFRSRAVFGGDPENPGIYYMSRSGDFDDFDYSAAITDRARAMADLTTTSDAGGLSIPLSAIAAITEDYCLFSAESELYLLRGDPAVGGIMGDISSQIGIGSRTAYCRVPDGSVVFLTRDGLYKFHPSQPFPQSMSREKLPAELIDVVQNTDMTVSIEYDVRFRGVHIYIVPTTAGATLHYWFDWEGQSFWLVAPGDTDYEPFAITYDAKENRVLLGCRDGYIRHYDAATSEDDGTSIASHMLYGPFSLGGVNGEGSIRDVYAVLDDASGDVEVDVMVGDDPETASKAAPIVSRTISAGFSKRIPVRARGAAAFIKISDSSGSQWAIDSLKLVTLRHGKHRG